MKHMEKVKCPECGYEMPVWYGADAECHGLQIRCKRCKTEFKPVIEKGKQRMD